MSMHFSQGDVRYPINGSVVTGHYIVLGMIDNNTYLLDDRAGGYVVVDPSCKPEAIIAACDDKPISAVILTHGHFDHVGALRDIAEHYHCPVYGPAGDAAMIETPDAYSVRHGAQAYPLTRQLVDGDTITTGAITWRVIHTPGHTPGSSCFYTDASMIEGASEDAGAPMLVSGDTLFCGTIGRTDFEGGSMDDMRVSLKKLAILPVDTVVLPGHNDLTTIGAEKERVFERYA